MSSGVSGVICLGFLLLTSVTGEANHARGTPERHRRSIMDLSSMVNDVTGRESSDFVAYGNWCGLGGSGRPVDPIDECCQIHDLCYNLATTGSCRSEGEKGVYQVEYKWKKAKDGTASCEDDPDKCKNTICMCDAVLTNCLKKNLEFYDSQQLHKLSLLELLKEANWISQP